MPGPLPLQLLEASLELQYQGAVQQCLWLSFILHVSSNLWQQEKGTRD
jgi:hypothetical protein